MRFQYSTRFLFYTSTAVALFAALAGRYLKETSRIVVGTYIDRENGRVYPRRDVPAAWNRAFESLLASGELVEDNGTPKSLGDPIAVFHISDVTGANTWVGICTDHDHIGRVFLVVKKEDRRNRVYRIDKQATVATLERFYEEAEAAENDAMRAIEEPFAFDLSPAEKQRWEELRSN